MRGWLFIILLLFISSIWGQNSPQKGYLFGNEQHTELLYLEYTPRFKLLYWNEKYADIMKLECDDSAEYYFKKRKVIVEAEWNNDSIKDEEDDDELLPNTQPQQLAEASLPDSFNKSLYLLFDSYNPEYPQIESYRSKTDTGFPIEYYDYLGKCEGEEELRKFLYNRYTGIYIDKSTGNLLLIEKNSNFSFNFTFQDYQTGKLKRYKYLPFNKHKPSDFQIVYKNKAANCKFNHIMVDGDYKKTEITNLTFTPEGQTPISFEKIAYRGIIPAEAILYDHLSDNILLLDRKGRIELQKAFPELTRIWSMGNLFYANIDSANKSIPCPVNVLAHKANATGKSVYWVLEIGKKPVYVKIVFDLNYAANSKKKRGFSVKIKVLKKA